MQTSFMPSVLMQWKFVEAIAQIELSITEHSQGYCQAG